MIVNRNLFEIYCYWRTVQGFWKKSINQTWPNGYRKNYTK